MTASLIDIFRIYTLAKKQADKTFVLLQDEAIAQKKKFCFVSMLLH